MLMHENALFGPVVDTGIGVDIGYPAIPIIQLEELHGRKTLIKIPTPAGTISDSSNIDVGTFALPRTSTRFVDTVLRVKADDQIATGGLVHSEEFPNRHLVSRIRRLPVIGALLQSDSKQRCNSEAIVLLTARQLKD